LNKHIGATRFLYNLALETKQTAYAGARVNLSRFELQKQLPELKKELPWLKEVNSQSLQYSLACLDTAYKNFFKNNSGFPKYKSKHRRESFGVPQNVAIDEDKLFIPKFKKGIKIILHRELKGEIKQATISKSKTGKFFASILVDNQKELPKKLKITEEKSVGVDLGLKDFLITSEGEVVKNPRHLRNAEAKLKFVQRKYSKYKGKKTKKKLQNLHERVANARMDFLHKTSYKLVSENQTICLEDLNVSGMMKRVKLKKDEKGNYIANGQSAKSGLNKSISDVGWSTFVEMVKYKADWQGKNVLFIGRFDPSSKTCSDCGSINKELALSDREWTCKACDITHDRDHNAAKNIKSFAMNKKNMCVERTLKNHEELPTLVGALTHEAHPIGSAVGE